MPSVYISKTTVEFATSSDSIEIGELSKKYIEHELGWRYTPARLRELLKERETNIIVARERNGLAGFGIMTYADQSANLDLLAVKVQFRRRGVGRQIVLWLEKVARTAGILNVYVQVRKLNPGAIEFYSRCGFQTIDEVSRYYGERETGVIMCKNIGQMFAAR
jgi:ribosomal-protein-alanine N-acetyltransferase